MRNKMIEVKNIRFYPEFDALDWENKRGTKSGCIDWYFVRNKEGIAIDIKAYQKGDPLPQYALQEYGILALKKSNELLLREQTKNNVCASIDTN